MWVRATIPTDIFQNEGQLYQFLDAFVKFCDDYKYCETFHFFIENCQKIDDCLERIAGLRGERIPRFSGRG